MLTRILFTLWFATLGADRLDLLGGRGPAVLLPFQVLTPLLVLALLVSREGWPPLPASLRRFGAWLLALITLLGLSLLQSADLVISAGRFTLLVATMLGVTTVLWGLSAREDRTTLLQVGARAGIALSLLFNVASALALLGVFPDSVNIGPASLNLEPTLYGTIPRLAGPTLDMNRGAMLVLVFGTFIAMGPPTKGRPFWIAASLLMLLGSLSRSAVLAALVVFLVAAWQRSEPVTVPSRSLRTTGSALLLALALVAVAMLQPSVRERTASALAPLAERLELREGSAQTHAYLFARGVEAGTRSLPQAMLGTGFGTSFRELADVFGGNPYGNYHSAWLQLWVEAGFVTMLVALAVSLLPLRRRRQKFAGLVLGLCVYNTFYIGFGDHLFWLTTGLAWMEVGA